MRRQPYLQPWQRDPYFLNRFPNVNGRYAPVRGGRWFIRRLDLGDGLKWHAWCRGQAKRYSETFHSWEEAMYWATQVAQAFHRYDSERKTELLALKRLEGVIVDMDS